MLFCFSTGLKRSGVKFIAERVLHTRDGNILPPFSAWRPGVGKCDGEPRLRPTVGVRSRNELVALLPSRHEPLLLHLLIADRAVADSTDSAAALSQLPARWL